MFQRILNRKKGQTSEKVKDVVRCLFCFAALMAAIADLAFVAKGTKMNDTKKGSIFTDSENSRTVSTRGSAKTVNIKIPTTNSIIALSISLDFAFASSWWYLSVSYTKINNLWTLKHPFIYNLKNQHSKSSYLRE